MRCGYKFSTMLKKTLLAAAFAMILIPTTAQAQSSSINAFSPFTFYGLGDVSVQGATHLRGMGGAATAYRDGSTINYVNPASLSAMYRKSFLFEVGLEVSNHYLKTADQKTSFNTFNVRDLAIQFPIYKKLGMSMSFTPFSSVGYRVKDEETDPAILAGLLQGGAIGAIYRWNGEGDINQAKASIGWEPIKNLSIGVDMIYYFGKVNRSFLTEILADGSTSFFNTEINQTERVSRIMWNFGAQYDIIRTNRKIFTLGATFHPSASLNPEVTTTALNVAGAIQHLDNGLAENFTMPNMISLGMFYQTPRLNAGVDYAYQDWGKFNRDSEFAPTDGTVNMNFRNTNSIKAGMSYTPNLYDARRFLKRLTYRVGVRYSDYYMRFNDTDISDMAITLGVGIPVKIMSTRDFGSHSYVDIGLDLGRRGTTKSNLIQENYFKVSIGLRLFGNDQWFRKMQYQ